MSWLPKDFDPEEYEEQLRTEGKRLSRKASGEDLELEAVSDALLAKSRRGVTKHSDLRDWLTRSQLDLRRDREVYPTQGFPEAHLFQGLYRRAFNPNSRGERSSNAVPGFGDNEGDHS